MRHLPNILAAAAGAAAVLATALVAARRTGYGRCCTCRRPTAPWCQYCRRCLTPPAMTP